MNVSSRTARRLPVRTSGLSASSGFRATTDHITGWLGPDSVCSSCLARLSIRSRGAATAAATVQTGSTQTQPDVPTALGTRKTYQVRASVVVSRPPLLTRTLHPFEKAFYLYQRRLNERLALPFTRYFYYKKGTPGHLEWTRKIKQRRTAARDIGIYNAYSEEGWNDELLIGDKTSEPEHQLAALIEDAGGAVEDAPAIPTAEGEGEQSDPAPRDARRENRIQRPNSRITEADTQGDEASLNRHMDQTLYLLIKNKRGQWKFPEDTVKGKEGLHDVRWPSRKCHNWRLTGMTGSGAYPSTSRRHQYEHMGSRQCTDRTLQLRLP